MKETPQGSNPEPSSPGDSTLETITNSVPDDPFLSGAYSRILRTSIALSITATLIASFFGRFERHGISDGIAGGMPEFGMAPPGRGNAGKAYASGGRLAL